MPGVSRSWRSSMAFSSPSAKLVLKPCTKCAPVLPERGSFAAEMKARGSASRWTSVTTKSCLGSGLGFGYLIVPGSRSGGIETSKSAKLVLKSRLPENNSGPATSRRSCGPWLLPQLPPLRQPKACRGFRRPQAPQKSGQPTFPCARPGPSVGHPCRSRACGL
jgi:hypothetical protein